MAKGRKGHTRKSGSKQKKYVGTLAQKMGLSQAVKEDMDRTARENGVQPIYVVANRVALAADYFKKRARAEGYTPSAGNEPWNEKPIRTDDPKWPGNSRKA